MAFIPRCQPGNCPVARRIGLAIQVNTIPRNDPTTAKNGSTSPTRKFPISIEIVTGVAGSAFCVFSVKSTKISGINSIGFFKNVDESAGIPTYSAPKTSPSIPPIETTRHRHESPWPLAPSDESASAVTPKAPTGAIGNGSFSTSDVTRNSTYPRPKRSSLPSNCPSTIMAMGPAQPQ